MTSVGAVSRVMGTTFFNGIGSLGTSGRSVVIGISNRVSIDLMSFSQYWTPTKYWFLLLGSIQKLCLLNWMLELKAATTFFITSAWVKPRSAALSRSTVILY